MYKQLPYHGILAVRDMLEQHDFTEERVTLSGPWEKHQRGGDVCSLFWRVRVLLWFPALPGLWPWFTFMTASLASSFRSPFLSTLSRGHVSSFLPASKLDLFTLKTNYEFLTPVSQVSVTVLVSCCPLVNGCLIPAIRVSIDKARIFFRKMDVSLFQKQCRPQSSATESTVVTTITQLGRLSRKWSFQKLPVLQTLSLVPSPKLGLQESTGGTFIHTHHVTLPRLGRCVQLPGKAAPAQPGQHRAVEPSDQIWPLPEPETQASLLPESTATHCLLAEAPTPRSSGIQASWGERERVWRKPDRVPRGSFCSNEIWASWNFKDKTSDNVNNKIGTCTKSRVYLSYIQSVTGKVLKI